MTFSENPSKLGLPSYHTDHWDPFFAACVDNEVTVCLHIGSSSSMPLTAADAAPEVMITLTPLNSMQALTDIIFSGVFKRFPRLQMAMSEGGIGWMPYNAMTHENAMRCFSFDPFKYRERELATVGALRAEAAHVDTSPMSMGRRKTEAGAGLSSTLAAIGSKGGAEGP